MEVEALLTEQNPLPAALIYWHRYPAAIIILLGTKMYSFGRCLFVSLVLGLESKMRFMGTN